MSKPKTPFDMLRHHVTGAIERGEKTAVTAVEAPKHTPGPWTVVNGMRIETSDGKTVVANAGPGAFGPYYLHECEANAALIAAAPEMLLALKDALACIEKNVPETVFAPREMIRAAIARAEGRE